MYGIKNLVLALATMILLAGEVSVALATPGAKSSPPINIDNATLTVTNGVASCLINSFQDRVALEASGAVDIDKCKSGNQIDLSKNSWSTLQGDLGSATGSTNYWVADTLGSTTITVNFNDAETEGDYNDDEDPNGKSVTVTGFKVGGKLTTSAGGNYIHYHDNSTSGSETENMTGVLTGDASLDYTTGSSGNESKDVRATWTIVVVPANTPTKGDIKISGLASSRDGWVAVQTRDGDWDVGSNGTNSLTIGITYLATVAYNVTWDDDNTASAMCGVRLQSDAGWLSNPEAKATDMSLTSDQAWKQVNFNPNIGWANLTGKEGDEKRADFVLAYRVDTKWDGSNSVYADAIGSVPWGFALSSTVKYISP